MLNSNSTTAQRAATPSPTSQKLERARARVRLALRTAEEASDTSKRHSFTDYDTLDTISRALNAAVRDLDELTMTLAVMERKTR